MLNAPESRTPQPSDTVRVQTADGHRSVAIADLVRAYRTLTPKTTPAAGDLVGIFDSVSGEPAVVRVDALSPGEGGGQPAAHAASHATGQSDALAPSAIGAMPNPMTTYGDVIYAGAGGVPMRLSGVLVGKRCLVSAGDGTNAQPPSWETIETLGGVPNLMAGVGDLIYGGDSGVATKLQGHVQNACLILTETGSGDHPGVPVWRSIAEAGGVPNLFAAAGDMIVAGTDAVPARLQGNVLNVLQVLTQTGDGNGHSAAPVWAALGASDVGAAAANHDHAGVYLPVPGTKAAIAVPGNGGDVIDAECRTAVYNLLVALQALQLIDIPT